MAVSAATGAQEKKPLFPTFGKVKNTLNAPLTPSANQVLAADVSPYFRAGARKAGRFAKGLANAPVNVAEGRFVGIIPEPLVKLFWWILKFAFGLIVISAIILSIIAGWNYYQAGLGASQVQHAGVAVQETGIPILAKLGLQSTFDAIFNPEKLAVNYGFESDIQQSSADENLGVKFTEAKQVGLPYYNDPVEVIATISAKSPEDDMKLVGTCQLGDGEILPAALSSASSTDNEARLYKNQLEIIQMQCLYPKGIQAEKSNIVSSPLSTTEKTQIKTTETAHLYATFEFDAKASHNTYFMKELDWLLRLNEDPFSYYKVKDPQLMSDRRIRSTATAGPINLGIGTLTSQPFVENTPYSFGVSITNNGNWNGKLKKIENLEVAIPPFLVLEGEPGYGDKSFASTCAFDYTGQTDSDGFKIYTLKESLLARTNQDCSKENLQSSSLTEQQCIDLFGKNREIVFRCNFKAPTVEGEGLQYDFIRAEAKYIYQVDKNVAVDAVARPEMVTGLVA